MTKTAKETCGESEKRIENPWMIGKDEELQQMKSRIAGAVTERNRLTETARQNRQDLEEDFEQARQSLREARRVMKRETRRWEKDWWNEKIREYQEAEEGDSGKMYKVLKDMGKRELKGQTDSTTITKENFREHFKKVSEQRFENTPDDIERAVNRVTDISNTDTARQWGEILTEMRKMRDSAPGEDGVRLIMLMEGGEEVTQRIIRLVQFIFNNDADKWEGELKVRNSNLE